MVKVKFRSLFELTWLKLHLKCCIPSPKVISLLFLEKKIFKEFLPCMGAAAILVTRINFRSSFPWRLNMKFGLNWSSTLGEEDICKWWTTDGLNSMRIL